MERTESCAPPFETVMTPDEEIEKAFGESTELCAGSGGGASQSARASKDERQQQLTKVSGAKAA